LTVLEFVGMTPSSLLPCGIELPWQGVTETDTPQHWLSIPGDMCVVFLIVSVSTLVMDEKRL
jgi:hypothetical protein